MGFLITVPMLIGLVLLLDRTSSALLCATIWAAGVFLMSLFVATDFGLRMIVMAAVAFLMALGYFALLDYLRGKGWWWVAMPVGGMILIGIAQRVMRSLTTAWSARVNHKVPNQCVGARGAQAKRQAPMKRYLSPFGQLLLVSTTALASAWYPRSWQTASFVADADQPQGPVEVSLARSDGESSVLTSLSIALGGKALKTPLFESSRVANPLIADAQLLVASAFCVGSEACTPGPLLLIVPILPVSADAETDDCAPMLKVQFWHDGVQRITLERCPEGTSSEEVLFGA